MNPINLTDYAKYSQKISSTLLQTKVANPKAAPVWKIFAAYFWDFSAIVMATYAMGIIFGISADKFMLTRDLRNSFADIELFQLVQLIMPVTICSYFFFSYFFNEGQTWGMNRFKTRLNLPSKGFKSSFHWALYSSAILYTCGLIYPVTRTWISQSGFGSIETHDFLYHNLMEETLTSPIDLLNEIESFKDYVAAEEFKVAA